MKHRHPKFQCVYVNSKEFTITKHFATEDAMDRWLDRHAVTIKLRGPYTAPVFA